MDGTSVAERLRLVPLLQVLEPAELEAVAVGVRIEPFAAGAVVVRQGEPGDGMFLVLEGQVRVVSEASGERALLARLGPGEFFGEMALLTDEPRNATVVTESDAVLGVVSRHQLHALVARRPELDDELTRVAILRRRGRRRRWQVEAPTRLALAPAIAPAGLGSAPGNALVIEGPGVAAHHARLLHGPEGWMIEHLGGAAGTLVNREPVGRAPLGDGDVIALGSVRLLVLDTVLKEVPRASGVRIDVEELDVRAGGRALLSGVDFVVEPGEFVAIVGPSGAGKSVLLEALAGIVPPSAGLIRFDGHPAVAADVRRAGGYVPGEPTLHPDLTVREALSSAAQLRLPDLPAAEREQRLAALLAALQLEGQAGVRIGRLSAGQRTRAAIAAELLGDPRVIFLDEPTRGLDPGLDAALMGQLRGLADEGRTVVIATHATGTVRACDRVVVLNYGCVVFDGTPAEALAHFGVRDFAELYGQLSPDAAREAERYRGSPVRARVAAARGDLARRAVPAPSPATRRSPLAEVVRQAPILAARGLRVLARDRVRLALALLGAPVLAALLLGSFDADLFARERADGGNATQAVMLLFLAGVSVLFLGALTAAPALAGERGVLRRERLLGLSPAACVLAKAGILAGCSLLRGILFIAVLAIGIAFPSFAVAAQLAGVLALAAFAGAALGLLLSALSPSPGRAAFFAVLAILPQAVFAGAIIPQSEMSPVAEAVSHLTVTKWSLELSGSIAGLDEAFAAQYPEPLATDAPQPYASAFRGSEALRWGVLAAFAVAFLAGAVVAVSRLTARDARFTAAPASG